MKHGCEICNTQYNTVAEAEKCELTHKKEKEQETVKATAESTISEAINAFIAKYKVMPTIEVAEENQKILFGELSNKAEQVIDCIIDLLIGGDDEDECNDECTDCKCCRE